MKTKVEIYFFVAQHFDEKNNLLNNLRHIKKKEKLRTSSKQLLYLKRKKKVFVIQQK